MFTKLNQLFDSIRRKHDCHIWKQKTRGARIQNSPKPHKQRHVTFKNWRWMKLI